MATMKLAEAINQTIVLEMERDPDVLVLGIDNCAGGVLGVTGGLKDRFGENRVLDTPISEGGYLGAAVGAAAVGCRPVVELMFVDFIGVCMDQLFNQAAKMRYMFGGKVKIPLVLRAATGGGVGAAAQHSQSLEAWFMHIPGLKVVYPSTPYDAKGLLASAIQDDNPVVFLENKALYASEGEVPTEAYTIPIGKADIKREGSDVTVVATGQMVGKALMVAEKMASDGVSVEVLDPRSLLPLDEEAILTSVKKTQRLVIVHEEVAFAGSGAEIAAMVAEKAFDYLDAPIKRVAAPFCPVPFAAGLEAEYIPSENRIVEAIKAILE
ncbi:pyruvate dehydrogenase E1 component beta subunit [Desulfocicer vacuolatum DSM 3385]|uniref:Pyruvate dehydrogenase E1 component beta subunit n=1 Tax=Desulfocicer vacuolatum DSM 3385 TaxID=1121400 RepID=A0A1W2D6P5_9BACT|nr:alpha-ketoacid dehydrogenase subunit beta [Desulfocicer vacuolatum]SMC92718.1 pyruvate dehydrogenase E1 component beta subunit [Desulfocicer vacuolatum DSM 3385]